MIITENKNIILRCQKEHIECLELRRYSSTFGAAAGVALRKAGIKDSFLFNYPNNHPEWIILFDASVSDFYLKELQKRNPGTRLILWIWNPLKYLTFDLKKVPREYEIWSYSEKACEEYGFKHNTQFMFYDYSDLVRETESVKGADVFYIGKDKGRAETLIKLKRALQKRNFTVDMNIVANTNHSLKKKDYYTQAMPYRSVVNHILASKAVLDYYEDPNLGLSLRPLEALFFQKKLITNNRNIYHYDFYSPKNVFVIGKQSLNDLPDFMQTEMEDTSRFANYYDFNSWIKRFNVI